MKLNHIVPVLLSVLGASTHAQPQECTVRVSAGRGMTNFWAGKYDQKVAKILRRKGYIVVKDGPAAYELKFRGGVGFVCGTGLTWRDEVFAAEYNYDVEMKGPDVDMSKSNDGAGFIVGLNARLKRQALHAVLTRENILGAAFEIFKVQGFADKIPYCTK